MGGCGAGSTDHGCLNKSCGCTFGYIKNCNIYPRNGDNVVLFENLPNGFIARLDGYTIIPNEEFKKYKLDKAKLIKEK